MLIMHCLKVHYVSKITTGKIKPKQTNWKHFSWVVSVGRVQFYLLFPWVLPKAFFSSCSRPRCMSYWTCLGLQHEPKSRNLATNTTVARRFRCKSQDSPRCWQCQEWDNLGAIKSHSGDKLLHSRVMHQLKITNMRRGPHQNTGHLCRGTGCEGAWGRPLRHWIWVVDKWL